jgi:hypothetical protein
MSPKDWLTVVQILVTLAGMYVGPKLAIHYSLKQFHSTKWWERREQLFTLLLESLSFLRYHYDKLLHAEQMREGYSPPETDRQEATAAFERLKKSTEFGSYLLSDESAKAIQIVLWADGDYAAEYYEDQLNKLVKAIDVVKKKANLNIKPV